jgi:SAM-dependent methyltransferase
MPRSPALRNGAQAPRRVNLDAIWHDLECGGYSEDLPVWRALAREAGGPVLDVGAGTGRVALDLAAHRQTVVALDTDAALLRALVRRSTRHAVEAVVADARNFALGRRFRLIIVPMQTLQLLGGIGGRAAFLRCALDHLESGGWLAAALADALDSFDEDHAVPPPPEALELDGVRYASQLLAVTEDDRRATIHRRREIIGPGEHYESQDVVVQLDRVSADRVAREARAVGFLNEPHRFIVETEQYLGSTVAVLRAP